jgi:hypothetical protein
LPKPGENVKNRTFCGGNKMNAAPVYRVKFNHSPLTSDGVFQLGCQVLFLTRHGLRLAGTVNSQWAILSDIGVVILR